MRLWKRLLATNLPVLLIGGLVLYLLGQWQGGVTIRNQQLDLQIEQVLKNSRSFHASQDSLRAIEDSLDVRETLLAARSSQLTASRRALRDRARRDAGRLDSLGLDSLLPGLRLDRVAPNVFQTDSVGLRFLAHLHLRVQIAESEVAILDTTLAVERVRIHNLDVSLGIARSRADSAGYRVVELEGLLEAKLKASQCRIVVLRCPSRTTTFLIGAALGAVAGFAIK